MLKDSLQFIFPSQTISRAITWFSAESNTNNEDHGRAEIENSDISKIPLKGSHLWVIHSIPIDFGICVLDFKTLLTQNFIVRS